MFNIKNLKETYETSSFPEKKKIVLTILEVFLGKWENFDLIYHFIRENPEDITEIDINEVFQILIVWLYQDSQDKIKETSILLENIKEKIINIHLQEESEKQDEHMDIFLKNQLTQL